MSGTKCSKNVGRDKGQKKGERGRQAPCFQGDYILEGDMDDKLRKEGKEGGREEGKKISDSYKCLRNTYV